MNCLTNLWGETKKNQATSIQSAYQLCPYDTVNMTKLLLKKTFIYKPDEVQIMTICPYTEIHLQQMGKLISSKPFQHRPQYNQNPSRHIWMPSHTPPLGSCFTFSLTEDPENKDEKDMPVLMLALVAAAVS